MTQSKKRAGDEQLNERFNTLLREAADEREERSLVQATGDALAAKRESADLLALARERTTATPRKAERATAPEPTRNAGRSARGSTP